MVEAIEMIRPTYNAVNINIRKPEINRAGLENNENDKGIYNSVKVDIDNPSINAEPKKVYDYPESEEIVTYDKTYNQQVALPQGYPVAAKYEASEINTPEETEEVKVPEPNYTTIEAEKKTLNNDKTEDNNVSFHGTEPAVKKPEIVPPVDIKPEIDINKVVDNLNSEDLDKQALQMSEIIKTFDKPKLAKEYIVSDVLSSLINIAEKDTKALEGPTEEQRINRDKIMKNFEAVQKGVTDESKLPYKLTKEDIQSAATLAPLELAERNKEYALITMAMLDKIYIDNIEKENGNIVALTDVPGVSTMVDAIRYSKNPAVKMAAIDSLRYIARPEYKNELSEVFSIAQKDSNPIIAEVAAYSLNKINQN